MPRTSGDGCCSNATARGASAGSPELPMAIEHVAQEPVDPDALDRDRRRTGLGTRRRRAATARRALGAARSSRACSFASRPTCRELVPGADGEAVVAAVDAVAHQAAAAPRRSGPCARSSDRRCSAAHRAGRAPGRPPSGRRRGRRGRSRNDRRPAGRARASSVVKIEPRNSQEPNSRDTRLVCLPCQPRPAAAASGFSITGAVSTKTLTSAARAAARQRSRPGPSACP